MRILFPRIWRPYAFLSKKEIQKANLPQSTGPKLIGKISPDCFGMVSIFPKSFRSGILPDIGPFHFPFWVQFKS